MKKTTLTLKNLTELFAVTAPTVYSWQLKLAMPRLAVATPNAIKRWAKMTGTAMTCEPSTLLGKDIIKPGPKPLPAFDYVWDDNAPPKKLGKGASTRVILATTRRPATSSATKSVAKRKVAR